jgi:HAD-hyrolase-like protein
MVGDDAETDVAGALSGGLRGILVKTGKYSPEGEERLISSSRASPSCRRRWDFGRSALSFNWSPTAEEPSGLIHGLASSRTSQVTAA